MDENDIERVLGRMVRRGIVTAVDIPSRRARVKSGADIGISVTGNAGPEPSEGKPVGLVYVGLDSENVTLAEELHIQTMEDGGREYIREMAASRALYLALKAAKQRVR